MKDFNGEIQYKGQKYRLVFNLNVMETIQEKYGSLDEWGSLTDGSAFGRGNYEKENGTSEGWDDLKESDKEKYGSEPNAKAVIFGFTEMLNEGIDMDNEENGTDIKPFTLKQVGRIISEIGLMNATNTLNETVIQSTKSDEKNE